MCLTPQAPFGPPASSALTLLNFHLSHWAAIPQTQTIQRYWAAHEMARGTATAELVQEWAEEENNLLTTRQALNRAGVCLPTQHKPYFQGASPGGSMVKNPPDNAKTWLRSLGQEDPLEKEMATHSSILAWEIPGTEEHGGLQSMGLQKSQT